MLYLENLKTENEEKLNGVKTFVKEVREQSDTAIEENRRKTYLVVSVGILATALMVILFFALRNFYIKKKEKQIIEEELAVKEKHIENLEVKMSDFAL